VALLEELAQKEEHKDNKDFLYYIAYGHHRMGNFTESEQHIKHLLELDENNQAAKSLQTLTVDKSKLNARFGMFFLVLAAAGVYLIYDKFRGRGESAASSAAGETVAAARSFWKL